MKARQSPLARQVLADPKAREQLLQFLATRRQGTVIELKVEGQPVQRLQPVLVPKAA